VRVQAARISGENFRWAPPPSLADLRRVRRQRHPALTVQDEPQTDVEMAMILPDRTGHGQEQWTGWIFGEDRHDAQLLFRLPARGVGRVLVLLDMPTRRKPQAGIDVVDEQSAAVRAMDQDDVGDQVPVRCRRLDLPEHIVGELEPAQGVCSVLLLDLVRMSQVSWNMGGDPG